MFTSTGSITKIDGPVVLNKMKQYVLETTYGDWYIYEDCNQTVVSPESVNLNKSKANNLGFQLTNSQVASLTPEQIADLSGPAIEGNSEILVYLSRRCQSLMSKGKTD